MNPKPETRNPSPQTSREASNLAAKRPNLAPSGAKPLPAAGSPAEPANPTAEAIVRRLPDKPLLTARDVADALFLVSTGPVTDAVDSGSIHAVRIGKQYRIARDEAARWIRTLEAAR